MILKKSIWTSAVSLKRSQKWSQIPLRQLFPLVTLFWKVTVFGLSFTQKNPIWEKLVLVTKMRRDARPEGNVRTMLENPRKTHKFSGNFIFLNKSSNIKITHKFSRNFRILKKSSSIGHWWSSSNCLRQVHEHILHPVKIYRAVLDFIDA